VGGAGGVASADTHVPGAVAGGDGGGSRAWYEITLHEGGSRLCGVLRRRWGIPVRRLRADFGWAPS